MTATAIDVDGYRFEFKRELTRAVDPAEVVKSPYKGEIVNVPYKITGEPGLINVSFKFRRDYAGQEDAMVHGLTAVLAPAGIFTAFTRGQATFEGVVEVPTHMLPSRVEIKIQNLSRVM